MWEMAQHSVVLFFRGKLFSDPRQVAIRMAIGVLLTAAILIVGTKAGLPIWLAGLIAGFGGGALQPYLFKDLRYR